ncbi:putative transmembrane protein [Heterostelium album PN500]|uniref:Putative transmembrane protein n=1 Tax=Heterostelium pallidum (strain ATCC 26659 / Pp 5 / PN500) TaxID=670386 RepID=D3BAQ9_HETP5|nr:putative transmembrane protein [Heterostelium album PN500]EFA81646.1 putative transmembrane protein [Heterostelium album PN500]|eukprot:XP_020433763.1 putative transmembrane protein [Heterostelium album PN500]
MVSLHQCVHGQCSINSNSTYNCSCAPNYTGASCDQENNPTPPPTPTPTPTKSDTDQLRKLDIALPIAFGSLIILFIVTLVIMIKRKGAGGYEQNNGELIVYIAKLLLVEFEIIMGFSQTTDRVRNYFKVNFIDSLRLVDKQLLRGKLHGLALGQLISLCICGTGVFSQLLVVNYGVNIPTSQSLLNYILLMFYSIVLIKRGTFWKTIKTKSHILIPLALIDVEANYVVVKAYQYTTITSIMLLDCFTIPCVVILTRIFLKTRYTFVHILAVVLSIVGMVILVVSDILQGESANGGSNPLLGDMLVLISCVLYSISNVGQEFTVKKYDNYTYLALLGIYGSIISAIQLSILERNELTTMVWSGGVIGYIIGFAICLFAMYSITPFMMRIAGATMMNLSLLTSDLFSIIFAIFLFDRKLHWLYFLSFVIIISGLAIYNLSQPHHKSSEVRQLMDNDTENNNQELDIESNNEKKTATTTEVIVDSTYNQDRETDGRDDNDDEDVDNGGENNETSEISNSTNSTTQADLENSRTNLVG